MLAAISPSFSNSPCPQHRRYKHARRSLTKQGGRTRAQRVLTRLQSSKGRGGWEPERLRGHSGKELRQAGREKAEKESQPKLSTAILGAGSG